MNANELTEREKQILDEGNAEQFAAMQAARIEIERDATKSGRYPLWLAVEMMTDNLKARWQLRDKLEQDARYGRLPLYRPGDILPEEYRAGPLVLKEMDEYSWRDLNSWLDENVREISFRFQAPAAQSQAAPSQSAGSGGTATGTNMAPHRKGSKWTESEWRELLEAEKKGQTPKELANFHGVSRQVIDCQLKKARKQFRVGIKSDLSMGAQMGRLVTFPVDK